MDIFERLRKMFRRHGLMKFRENVERDDYLTLESTAIKDEFSKTNIAKIADELDEMGFATSITSDGGKDRSDLLLKVRKKVRENKH